MNLKKPLVASVGGVWLLFSIGPAAGQFWTETSAPSTNWSSVACSADGSKLVAVVNGDGIYTSADSGGTWRQTSVPDSNWLSLASSADGTKLLAVANPGGVYFSIDSGATWTAITNLRNEVILSPPRMRIDFIG